MQNSTSVYYIIVIYLKLAGLKVKLKQFWMDCEVGALLQQDPMTTAMVQDPDKCAKQCSKQEIQYSIC